jgi:uncharacterized Zn finger protein (UPF0148 family)
LPEEEIRNHRDSVVLLKCPNCGAPLDENQNGIRTCKYCGYKTKVAHFSASRTIESVKLPSKNKCVVLYRRNSDETLPIALPPFDTMRNSKVIDEIYANFEDKRRIESILQAAGYYPVTVNLLRQSIYGCMTDSQIKELILQSKKVTPQEIREIVLRSDVQKKYKITRVFMYILGVVFLIIFFTFFVIFIMIAAQYG